MTPVIRWPTRLVAAGLGYFAAAWMAGALTVSSISFTTFRPPNAVILGLALLDKPSRWWLYVLATIPGNPSLYVAGVNMWARAGYVFANMAEVGLALMFVHWVLQRRPRFYQLRDCVLFLIGVAGVASGVAATIGTAAVAIEGLAREPLSVWRNWLFTDALAFVVLTPLVILAAERRWRMKSDQRGEALLLSAGLIIVTLLAVGGELGQVSRFPALVYAPLPFLIWAAIRFGPTESALAVLGTASVVLPTALLGRGAFSGLSEPDTALSMQLLLLILAAPMMILAAVIDERQTANDERARLEAQMEQARKMEAVGRLAGGVAHDFNNLLQAIKGYVDMASNQIPPDHRAAAPLEQAGNAADRAAALTTQLLTFSRSYSTRTERLDLNAIVRGVAQIMERLIGDHIRLAVHPAPGLEGIDADRSQIEQVVMNLCINSRDAMPRGGTLTIETGTATFAEEDRRGRPWTRPGTWVFLRVADQGTGIAPEVLPRIFEPFFTTKAIGHGTGLGLSTVYAIVERHGGLINCDTSFGVGTAVTAYFPPSKTAPTATAASTDLDADAATGHGETVLIAEDEPFVRELLVDMLDAASYKVLVAADGAEAEALARQHAREIDIAVLDVVMPNRNGRQVYDTIQQLRPGLPVVFCSGYSFGELADVESLEGARVLSKPYSRATLLVAMREALDSRARAKRSQQ